MSARLKGGGNEIMTNQPVDLIVRITNSSTTKSVTLTDWFGAQAFPPGWSQPVISKSDIHPGLLKDGSFSGTVSSMRSIGPTTVPPKGSYEYEFYLGVLNECRTNDIYTIVVQRMAGTNFMVTSKPLCLKVVPGEWKDPNPLAGPNFLLFP